MKSILTQVQSSAWIWELHLSFKDIIRF